MMPATETDTAIPCPADVPHGRISLLTRGRAIGSIDGMTRLLAVIAVLVAGCGEDEGDTIAVAIASPAPGAEVTRDSLDALGALIASVPVEVDISGAPPRVALSIGDVVVGDLGVDGSQLASLPALGPATLTATAYDAEGTVLATASVDITVVDPTLADCHAWLDLYKVGYTVGPARIGVTDPVTAMMPINGMPFRSSGAARTTMFADCLLIKSLAEAASSWRARKIIEVTDLGVYNYRCINNDGTPPNCTIGLSEHSYGNAIDLAIFKDADGMTYSVKDDWVIDPSPYKTCMDPTVPGKDTFMHVMICELKARGIWNIVLTPNYNSLHRDHFHVDLTAGGNTIKAPAPDEPGSEDHGGPDLAAGSGRNIP